MSEKILINTDVDLPIQASVCALVNDRGELVIDYTYEDDEELSSDFRRAAIVDREDTLEMAKYYGVQVEQLPQLLYDECGVAYDSVPSDVERVFQDVLNFILESGVRYKFRDVF